ncbi:restriction system component [Butyrivibrio hungatei]|uniref:Restriction system component n=1 Tax=Butyrivibrio hungatei TaxID=185008 RepID=A0A1D9P0D1_9FIRM|nr:restriction system component [Butyrivibrio hungatei]
MIESKSYDILKQSEELIPDEHDGSYEMMRSLIAEYANMESTEECTVDDLNAIYAMAIGTWTQNIEKKKDCIDKTHLPNDAKDRMHQVLDRIWDNACYDKYSNSDADAKGDVSVGMFGTGFYSFAGDTSDENARAFIKMCVDVANMEGGEFERVESVFSHGIKGMQAASASVMLHCLKPYVFPIINNRDSNARIYKDLGLPLEKSDSLINYIANSRVIEKYRDNNFPFKNYRRIDVVGSELFGEFWPSLREYNPGITKEKYKELLQNPEVTSDSAKAVIYRFYQVGGQATCKQLANTYGKTPTYYNSNATNLAKNILKKTNCPTLPRSEENSRYWPILFVGRRTTAEEAGTYLWKLREPLKEAIKELMDEGVIEENIMNVNARNSVKSLNTILYGPPGTGKTYSTASYAVSICDDKPIDELGDRDAIMERFNKLKAEKRIVFTTFHQSYGYEEFIEGIKPQLKEDSNGIGYEIADGVFKEFCNEARTIKVHTTGTALIKEQPRIWGMILEGTGKTKLKTECFANNEIRLGWDEVKDSDIEGDFYGDENASWNGKHMVFDFKNTMEKGDVVVIEKTNKSIDAIGVITGDYEYDESRERHARSRKVEWLVKDIDQDIVGFLPKGRKQLARFSLFAFDYIGMETISKILEAHSQNPVVEVEKEVQPYVFIIDEINRGNISKIFGELITLIEDTKREGALDAASAVLPYSGEEFSVPSNVYILGTMNTADRSIALLDTALRRRFSFVEMMPNDAVLEGINKISGQDLDVSLMLRTINKRIEFLYDREHTIGHAFFMGLKDNPTKEKLATIFENAVIPLLQEYFYEDYQKIQLVLGDNAKTDDALKFVTNKEVHLDQTFKGNVEDIVDEKPMEYEINKEAFTNIEAYRQIM